MTGSSRPTARCVNLDWLEVHAYEPIVTSLNAIYFRAQGWIVDEREYGTRVYREMFTLRGRDNMPLLEVRRNPASQGLNGVHQANECHIRLVNRACYFDDAASWLNTFLQQYGYYNVRISRVDVCLDFVSFDRGDDPAAFVRRYFKHKYAKINQGRISAHGDDTWTGQEWNSLSWGSKKSAVSTKMYNKTMELYDQRTHSYKKPHIRYAWLLCGLVDDYVNCTKDGKKVDVWRVEFSLKSSVRNWVRIDINGERNKPQSLRNDLTVWDSRDKLLVMFASLANHYFRFKYYDETKRKDRCPDKVLFQWKPEETVFSIGRDDYTLAEDPDEVNPFERLAALLHKYKLKHSSESVSQACDVIIQSLTVDAIRRDLVNSGTDSDLAALLSLLDGSTSVDNFQIRASVEEVAQLLNIHKRTIDFSAAHSDEKGGTVVPPSDFQYETT